MELEPCCCGPSGEQKQAVIRAAAAIVHRQSM
jgi:hypothetical protein